MNDAAVIDRPCPIRRVGQGAHHHFFGYYNKNIWDRTGRFMLANRVNMMTGDLTGREVAEVGLFDLADGDTFHSIGTTTTWNWQMGCQSQWLEGEEGRKVIYNTRATKPGGIYPDFASTICDLDTGAVRELPLPIYSVAPNSAYAVCVDYSRFQVTHRTIGYSATVEEPALELAPANDGLHIMDLKTGEAKLVLSLEDLRNFHPVPSMDKAIHWITHLEINPSSTRILFIHRWTERVEDETCFLHRLITVNPDGSDLRLLECTDHPLPQLADDFDPNAVGTFDYEKSEYQISHPMWRDDTHVIVWGPHNDSIHYHLYDDTTGAVSIIGSDVLTENGHMTYRHDGRWILSDTYPDDRSHERFLILYDTETGKRYNIASLYADPTLGKENRCDLHPRWSRDGMEVCVDSVHENVRQLYIVDVSEIVG
jgi:hypothetical protein